MDRQLPEAAKHRLDELYEAFSVVAEGTYVYLCDMKLDLSRWSESAVTTFGLPSEYMFGAGDIWEEHIHPEDRESYHRSIAAIFSGEDSGHDMQYRARKPNGEYEVCTCRGVVIRGEDGQPEYFGGAIRNHGVQGRIDTLVGLRNQYGFFEDLNGHIIKNHHVYIVMVGLSHFAEINQIYGYLFGNRVLQRFGRHLFEVVGNNGHVYRLDGTRFAVITSTLDPRQIEAEYKRFREYCRSGLEIDGQHILLSPNAGFLDLDNFSVDVRTIYTCLNFAYGESKYRHQGELFLFDNGLSNENRQRIALFHDVRTSVAEDNLGFFLHYQPVVDAQSGRLIGAEALLRWQSEKYGLVMPDQFIAVLEQDPLFPELGRWILKTALCDAKRILAISPDFVINVNLSYTQLEKPDFADMVLEILRETDYPPHQLCLEITERCRLLDTGLLQNVVARLRGEGIRFALDDFGTGFSSLGIMRMIHFDTVKVDRSFILHVEEDDEERKFVERVIALAASLGSKVCVEGVETGGTRDILRNFQTGSFQGYLFGKPAALEAFLRQVPDFPQ